MIKVYKQRHSLDLTKELVIARKVAQFAIENRDKLSTKYVKHLGLHSHISGPILRKYGFNRVAKKVSSVTLLIAGSKVTVKGDRIWVPTFKLFLNFPQLGQVRQLEWDKDYVYVYYKVDEPPLFTPEKHIGVDLNTTGHSAVAAVQESGKVIKLGRKALHTQLKYRNIRRNLQKRGLFKVLAKVKKRQSNIIKDINHKTSRTIVDLALKEKGGIQLERLTGIRKGRKIAKSFKYALNSWSFYQLGKFIEYKALLAGVPVAYVDPAYSSKVCSRCGLIGDRNKKIFKCSCGHVDHADSNAAFNLCKWSDSIAQSYKERVLYEGVTTTPQVAMS